MPDNLCPECQRKQESTQTCVECGKCFGWEPSIQAGLYQALMVHAVHQDNYVFSRLQFLVTIQGAIIGGAYLAWKDDQNIFGVFIAIMGALATLFLYHIVQAASANKWANRSLMDALANVLVPDSVAETAGKRSRAQRDEAKIIAMNNDPQDRDSRDEAELNSRVVSWAVKPPTLLGVRIPATIVNQRVYQAMLIMDVLLAVLLLVGPHHPNGH
jgi:hypothetical protein